MWLKSLETANVKQPLVHTSKSFNLYLKSRAHEKATLVPEKNRAGEDSLLSSRQRIAEEPPGWSGATPGPKRMQAHLRPGRHQSENNCDDLWWGETSISTWYKSFLKYAFHFSWEIFMRHLTFFMMKLFIHIYIIVESLMNPYLPIAWIQQISTMCYTCIIELFFFPSLFS